MKKLFLIFLFASFSLAVFCQNDPFTTFAEKEGYSNVNISKGILMLVPDNVKIEYGGIDFTSFVEKISDISMVMPDNKQHEEILFSAADKYLSSANYDKLGNFKNDKTGDLHLFVKTDKKIIKEIFVKRMASPNNVLLRVRGEFTAEDIQSLISASNR